MSKAIKFKNKNNEPVYPCSYYPIGSIYLSLNDVNPSTYFGGTWELIKDRFLIGAGNSYKAGTIGGSQNHRHDFKIGHRMNYYEIMCDNYANQGAWSYEKGRYSKSYGTELTSSDNYNSGHNQSGGGTLTESIRYSIGDTDLSSSLPPYLAVYIWRRIK